MGLTASACYIFLAVVLAPGLVQQGFNEIAVHMFILYWAVISNITPPVALACFPAAKIAETSHFRVGFTAVTLRSEEHTSELQSLVRISYAVFCLKKKTY